MDYTGIINNIASLHKIPNMDKEYVLYYDETNNARVFKLTEEGFNFDEHAYFILGGLDFSRNLKDTLYFHIKRDRDWFVNFMRYFEYPNITKHQQFINELLRWIEKFNPVNEDFNMEYIRQSLKANKKEDLALLKSNKAGILIEITIIYMQTP